MPTLNSRSITVGTKVEVARAIPPHALTDGTLTTPPEAGVRGLLLIAGIPEGTRGRVDDVRMGRVYVTVDGDASNDLAAHGLQFIMSEQTFQTYFRTRV